MSTGEFDRHASHFLPSAHASVSEHLAPNAPQEVNINDVIRTKIVKQLDQPTR